MASSKTAKSTLVSADKKLLVVELRSNGNTIREIQNITKISKSHVHRLLTAALEDKQEEISSATDKLLALELIRLDKLQTGIFRQAVKGDLGAVDRVLKITAQRIKLLGLEKQINRIELSAPQFPAVNPADEWTEEDEKKLEAELKEG